MCRVDFVTQCWLWRGEEWYAAGNWRNAEFRRIEATMKLELAQQERTLGARFECHCQLDAQNAQIEVCKIGEGNVIGPRGLFKQ